MIKQIALAGTFLFIGITSIAQKKVTWTENFDNNKNEWLIEDVDNYKLSLDNGVYTIKNKIGGKSTCLRTSKKINPLKDYSIELKMTQTTGVDNNGFGIQFGHDSWDDYYRFVISTNGYIKCNGEANGESSDIFKWEKLEDPSIINPIGKANVIRVEQKDNKTLFYVNNNKVKEIDRIAFVGTFLGPVAIDSMTVEFDYIKVTSIEESINLIDNPINGYKLENLGSAVNGPGSDRSPTTSADGKTMYYSRESKGNLFNAEKSEVWIKDLTNDEPSINLGKPINNNGYNFVVDVSPDQNMLIVGNTYKSDGSVGGSGVSRSYFRNGSWTIPEKIRIDDFVNDDKYVNYNLAPDGKHLISAIENKDSYGDKDLFVSFLKEDGTFSKPVNLGATINSFASEFSPFIAPDNKTMFFSSYGLPGYGSADIFVSKRLDDTWTNWSKPKNLGKEINSDGWDAYYKISAIGDYAYMVRSGDGGYGDDDLYRIKLPQSLKPDPIAMVNGRVFDKKTNKPIDAEIFYEDLATGKEIGIATSSETRGFKLALPKGRNYGFLAKAKGYIAVSQNLDLINLKEYTEKEVNLYLVPIEKGQVVLINNLFFDTGKSSLRKESYYDLNRLVEILKNNPDVQIEIQGHTDNQGSESTNLTLSENRAKAVTTYLVSKGIDKSRLTNKGFGETKPVQSNDTATGRQMNRRVEFLIK